MASLISPRSLAPSLSLLFLFFSLTGAQEGKDLYMKHCASCHHENRIGRIAPPLIPQLLSKKSDEGLRRIIRKGIPATTMPAFPNFGDGELKSLIDYLRSPVGSISYSLEDIRRSYRKLEGKGKRLGIRRREDLVVAVDKGAGKVFLLEGLRVLDSFSFKNVHGGVKFSRERFYVPARDGWVISYSLKKGGPEAKVRACIYLRNIALYKDTLAVSCVLPPSLVFLNERLEPKLRIELEGRPSAVYSLSGRGGFILGFRDMSLVAFVSERGDITYRSIDQPLEDFFIDPLEGYIIGSSRKRKTIAVYKLSTLKKVYEKEIDAMPHLFSSAFWYSGGNFYFATRHAHSTKVSIWRMYDWKLVRVIDTGGRGFFVRTSPGVPDLWVDNSDSSFVLIDKRTLRVERLRLTEEGRATHVEFTPDGRFAYVSILGRKGKLLIYDPLGRKPLGDLPMVHPAGKYNYVLKTRALYPALLGREVFMAKCWGCHHTTEEAFGPPFRWIAKHRSKEEIVSQIINPEQTAKLLGYKRNAMPKIEVSNEEIETLLAFMEVSGDE